MHSFCIVAVLMLLFLSILVIFLTVLLFYFRRKENHCIILKQKIALLELVNDAFREGVLVFDINLALILWNSSLEQFFDKGKEFLVPRLSLVSFVRHVVAKGLCLADGVTNSAEKILEVFVNSEKIRIEFKDKSPRTFKVHRYYHAGIGFIFIFTDITKELTADYELEVAKKQAEVLVRARTEFFATMSHELRTPLNAIIGFSEIIQDQLLGSNSNDRYLGYVQDIHMSGSYLLEIVNDILSFSKIESGKHELIERPVDIDYVINATLRIMLDKAVKAGLSLKVDIKNTPKTFIGDEAIIKQMLVNLLSNAIKFTKSGGTVTIGAWSDETDELILQVRDMGVGFPEDFVDAPFGEVSAVLSRGYKSAKMGLWLVHELITLHRGYLKITSKKNEGSEITLHLPRFYSPYTPVAKN